ncbi:uncharacterized protein VTP21DRAFT_3903 [Calcarisporiella thermophila]|uniref:uncharacterized protein n=1 Tax=Calcarisporiella thermophila TaxID=911321 RepID=UPI0037449037
MESIPIITKIPPIATKLFEAKKEEKSHVNDECGLSPLEGMTVRLTSTSSWFFIRFAEIGQRLGRDEVWVAAVFYGQAKPTPHDVQRLASILDMPQAYIWEDYGRHYFPDRGGLISQPPSDPLLYRYHELLQIYGYPMKACIHEKMGDGVPSTSESMVKVERVDNAGDMRVRVTLESRWVPYNAW